MPGTLKPVMAPQQTYAERKKALSQKRKQRAVTIAGATMGLGAVGARGIPAAAKGLVKTPNLLRPSGKVSNTIRRMGSPAAQKTGAAWSNTLGTGTAVTGAVGSSYFSRDLGRQIKAEKQALRDEKPGPLVKALRIPKPRVKPIQGRGVVAGHLRRTPTGKITHVQGSV